MKAKPRSTISLSELQARYNAYRKQGYFPQNALKKSFDTK